MTHYPGHLRERFEGWVSAGKPDEYQSEEETAETADELLAGMTNSTDIMPSGVCDDLDVEHGTTYGDAARKLLEERAKTGTK